MKKFPLLMLAALAQMADAQQLSNTTFDSDWVNCYPWEAGSFVSSERGTQPEGWCISNVSQSQLPIVGEEVTPGANGTGKAVKLNNVQASIGDNTAPGYITLGTAFATAETKMTSVRNADGGVFGGIAFTYHPDAVRLTYKSDRSAGEENISVIAYLWKGTWTQAEVPSNTAVGIFSWGSATKVTMTDRIQNILGKECLTGGEITKTDDAALVASVEYYNNAAQEDWTTVELPLNYGEYAGQPVDVEKLNIVIASNGLFDDRGLIRNGNSVTVDDVELVYWHALSALSYEGATLAISEGTTSYDLSDVLYESSKLTYTVKGQAALVTESYDEETAVLTIRVEGEDIASNSSSFTEYTIQFKVPEVGPRVVDSKTYSEDLYVTVDGSTSEKQVADVVVETLDNGNINFVLKNFVLGTGDEAVPVGNILVEDIAMAADKSFAFQGDIQITPGDNPAYEGTSWFGPVIGNVPLVLSGRFVDEDHIIVYITIDMGTMAVKVHLGYAHAAMSVDATICYGTFCAPFAVTIPEGVKAYTVPSIVDDELLSLSELSGTIPANTPVVLYADAGFETTDFFGVAEAGTLTVGLLTGVYSDMAAPVGCYVLQSNDGVAGFYRVEAGQQPVVRANSCYLSYFSNTKAFFFLNEDENIPNPYQLANSTFDADWVGCYPWESGTFVSTARGSQPEGWCISNVANSAMPIVASEEVGASGKGKSVKLSNVTASIGGQNAPGYITLGTAWATAETKMTTIRNADGGVFGGIAFAYHPDAVRFTYKSDRSAGEENMSVVAYLWKGTWTQADVPSNTAVGIFDWGSATKVTMTDRIQNILGKECLTGGEITKTDDAALVASVEYYNNAAQEDWTTVEIPLNYGEYAGRPVDVEKLNIVIASNGLFDDRSAIKSGNSVTIDDVKLVYWHALSALSFEGASLPFSEETNRYDLSSVKYDPEKLAYVVKGQGATASTSFNEETRVLTIRVEGEDIEVNSKSFTEYKIQFRTEPDVEKLIPNVVAERTELLVDEQTTLTLVNCDGLVAEYSAPDIISYENGVVTAVGGGTATLILTQPETETIEAKVFEIEFTVSKLDAAWVLNVEDRYYFPNTVVENVFQVTTGDASLFSFTSNNAKIAKVKDGNLIIGEQTGTTTITVRCRGNSKWNASKQQYIIKVAEAGHVPFDLTQDLYELIKDKISGGNGWDANGGIRLGNNSEIFSWSNKDFVMEISGIPDKLSFTYSSSKGASSRDYRIFESADGENFTEIWRDNRGSGVDGNSYQSGDVQLSRDTRFIKFHYYGNCAAYFREIRVTELVKFEVDTQELHLNEKETSASFTFTHANSIPGRITVSTPLGITVTPSRIVGGMDVYDEKVVKVNYNVDLCDVDDDIVISDGDKTVKIHVVARLEDPDAIVLPVEDAEEMPTAIYNLAGQRIQKMQKGINIVNGKKILK